MTAAALQRGDGRFQRLGIAAHGVFREPRFKSFHQVTITLRLSPQARGKRIGRLRKYELPLRLALSAGYCFTFGGGTARLSAQRGRILSIEHRAPIHGSSPCMVTKISVGSMRARALIAQVAVDQIQVRQVGL